MPFAPWLIVLALSVGGAPPPGAAEVPMRVLPLPPVWTAASAGAPHVRPTPGFAAGGLSVRPEAYRHGLPCLRELQRLSIPFRRAKATRGVTTPIVVTGPIRGLRLAPNWGKKPPLMECVFALAMYRIAPIVLRNGVRELRYSSVYSYRYVAGTRHLSRHAAGLAIDVFSIRGHGKREAVVKKDWVKAIGKPGDCVGPVKSRKARWLRRLACDLERSRLLHLILTPDSDYAHRDHFHIAALAVGEGRHPRTRYAGRYKGRTYIPRRAVRRAKRRQRERRARASRQRRRAAARRRARRHRARARRARPRRR